MEIYEVGGCVRDEMLGIPSKDIDFSVVLTPSDFPAPGTAVTEPDPYNIMVRALEKDGNRIIRDKMGMPIGAEYMTVRAINPTRGAVDYVLARKDGEYGDGRRPDSVEIGTLYDDLSRRDFSMNAIAKDSEGAYIDPFNGVQDIRDGVIRAVGEPWDRLTEDALRAVGPSDRGCSACRACGQVRRDQKHAHRAWPGICHGVCGCSGRPEDQDSRRAQA
jgi:tRNA nucleotidyltransferase (CCA-adding enzyme)